MKLDQLSSPSITSLELIHPATGEPCGVVITGHTPDSAEWIRKQKELASADKQALKFGKKGERYIDLDPADAERRKKLFIATITDISGIDGWDYSPEAASDLLRDPAHSWMLEQWGEWVDDRSNFFGKRSSKPVSGRKTTAG